MGLSKKLKNFGLAAGIAASSLLPIKSSAQYSPDKKIASFSQGISMMLLEDETFSNAFGILPGFRIGGGIVFNPHVESEITLEYNKAKDSEKTDYGLLKSELDYLEIGLNFYLRNGFGEGHYVYGGMGLLFGGSNFKTGFSEAGQMVNPDETNMPNVGMKFLLGVETHIKGPLYFFGEVQYNLLKATNNPFNVNPNNLPIEIGIKERFF